MIILTTPHAVRCRVPADRVLGVRPGSPTTTVLLAGDIALAVVEGPEEVRRRLDADRAGTVSGSARHGRAR